MVVVVVCELRVLFSMHILRQSRSACTPRFMVIKGIHVGLPQISAITFCFRVGLCACKLTDDRHYRLMCFIVHIMCFIVSGTESEAHT